MLGINLMRIARPFIRFAANFQPSRIPFPHPIGSAQCSSLSERIFERKKETDEMKIWDLTELRNLSSDKTLSKYIDKALEMKNKWDDPALLVEVQKSIDKAFIKACETGEVGVVHRIVNFEYYNEISLIEQGLKDVIKIKLPEVKLSHIPKEDLYVIVKLLLEKEVKKLTIEDFEWALVHKNGYFFEFLLGYLANDKPARQLAIKDHPLANDLDEDHRGLEDPIYGSYEFILEHPRLKPFQEFGRTYWDQYNAELLATCERTMRNIQKSMKTEALDAQNGVNQKQLILLKNLHAAKDYSSLHWISRNSSWEPFDVSETS